MRKDGADVGSDLNKSSLKLFKADLPLREECVKFPAQSKCLLRSPERVCGTVGGSGDATSDVVDLKEKKTSQALVARGSKKVASVAGAEKQGAWIKYLSPGTGLLCLSASSSSSSPISLAARQSLKVHFGPSLVLVNTVGRGETLELGLVLERGKILENELRKANEQFGPELTLRATLTTTRDPFSWVGKVASIPKVGGSGLYQLSVQRPPQPLRGETSTRKELEEVTKQLDGVMRVSHGEGESLVLVGHIVHALAYTNHISRTFDTQLQHVWQPAEQSKNKLNSGTGEKWFIMTTKKGSQDEGALYRQLHVHHELSKVGKVVHLEQGVFGASHTFLVMIELSEGLGKVADNLLMMEVDPASLPSFFPPRYMVDNLGLYVVDGSFPSPCGGDLKNKFAKEMQRVGAVGFRKLDSGQSFSLQFVNPGGLKQASASSMASAFSLVVMSELKEVQTDCALPEEDTPWKVLGPSCQETCSGGDHEKKTLLSESGVDEGSNTNVSKEKGISDQVLTEQIKKDVKERKIKVKEVPEKTCEEKTNFEKNKKREKASKKMSSSQEADGTVFQSTDIRERNKLEGNGPQGEEEAKGGLSALTKLEAEPVQVQSEPEKEKPVDQLVQMIGKGGSDGTIQPKVALRGDFIDETGAPDGDGSAILTEDQLLSIKWKKTSTLTSYLRSLATFLGNFPDLKVEENEKVELVFPSRTKVSHLI